MMSFKIIFVWMVITYTFGHPDQRRKFQIGTAPADSGKQHEQDEMRGKGLLIKLYEIRNSRRIIYLQNSRLTCLSLGSLLAHMDRFVC